VSIFSALPILPSGLPAPGGWEKVLGGGRNGDLGDSFYLSRLGHGVLKSTGAVSWAFSAPWNLSASWGAARCRGGFVGGSGSPGGVWGEVSGWANGGCRGSETRAKQ